MTDETTVVETPVVATPEPVAEVTVAEALAIEDKREESVPLATFLSTKKEIKDLKAEIERLSTAQKPQTEIAQDLKALADEHGIDAGFLDKLARSIEAQTEAKLGEKLRPFEERDKADKINTAFQSAYSKAMSEMPEYEGVVSPAVIKSLSLDPSNAKKTFKQLIEETYQGSLSGKRTIETNNTPRGGNTAGNVDMDKARKDPAYFKEVMADPDLKKQYNTGLAERIVF